MMNITKLSCGMIIFGLASSAHALPRFPDNDGCWDGKTSNDGTCLRRNDASFKNGRLEIAFANRCSKRIYTKICIQRANGSDDCGADGMSPGETFSYYNSNSSGRYRTKVIGSIERGNDWICTGKISNWK